MPPTFKMSSGESRAFCTATDKSTKPHGLCEGAGFQSCADVVLFVVFAVLKKCWSVLRCLWIGGLVNWGER